MDCERALETLMSAADADLSQVPEYRDALEHCRTCTSCAGTARALALIARHPGPDAPAGLIDRILQAVAAERSDRETLAAMTSGGDADAAGIDVTLMSVEPVRTRRPEWLHWATFVTASAAVLLGAFFVARLGLDIAGEPGFQATDSAVAPAADVAGAPETAAPEVSHYATRVATAAVAPGFVVYDRKVWRVVDRLAPDRSTLTTEGTVETDLGSDPISTRTVLTSDSMPEDIVVVRSDGTLVVFSLVKRVYGGRPYVLTTDKPVRRYGDWPALPSRIPRPTGADGSPTFRPAGTDALGLTVHPFAGTDAADGFAIAPGTPATDPAAGNPEWTWWTPLD